jgi:type VI secretion system secreted protein VgrG
MEFAQLPGTDRKLIVDVIGGRLERDSVEAVKGTKGEKNG